MSDKEWYEGLTASELEGKHVHAVYDYGTVVDGELCRNGRVRLDHRDEDGAPVFVIDDGHVVNTFAHILSVSLVWDERDWEQLELADYDKIDAIVVNGHLLMARADPQKRDSALHGEPSRSSLFRVLCVASTSCRPNQARTGHSTEPC